MSEALDIRTFRPQDLAAMVALINDADRVDQMERWTTLEQLAEEMTWPNYHPDTDCFLAWDGARLAGFTDLFLRIDPAGHTSTAYTWGVVHPDYRRRGLGRSLMERVTARALERLPEVAAGPVHLNAQGRIGEEDRRALFEGLGMLPVRTFVNLARRIDNGLPAVDLAAGYIFRPFDLKHDVEEVWEVDTRAFADHWDYAGWPLEEFRRHLEMPHFRVELCLLAEERATGRIVGLCLNRIDPEWIARTGRQEGYVQTLGVLREHRRQGLGTALLAKSLHILRREGMDWVHLHADAENLTGAVRLYERVGFALRRASLAYRRTLRAG